MNLIEFIGFIVSFGGFLYLMFRRAFESSEKEREESPRNDDEHALHNFLKSLEQDMDESRDFREEKIKKLPPPALKSQAKKTIFKAAKQAPLTQKEITKGYDDRFGGKGMVSARYDQKDENDPYSLVKKPTLSRGLKILESLSSKKQWVILKEILDRPKSML